MQQAKRTFFTPSVVALTLAALIAIGLVMFRPILGQDSRVLITESIDETKLVTLVGNTRPEARIAQNDRGPVSDGFAMDDMLFQLKRAPALELQFRSYIDQLTDKSSPNFHKWLTAEQIGNQYGMAQQDLNTITGWLESHGFTIDTVYPATLAVAFSGTAGMIRDAFHTEIHYLEVGGQTHFANMSDPKIPEALAPAVVGVASMHDFHPRPLLVPRPAYDMGKTCSLPTGSTTCYSLVPADYHTIYNVNPVYRQGFTGGITGSRQTIALVEESNTYGTDVATYRTTFLSKFNLGSFTTIQPPKPTGSGGTCTNPTTNSADGEADLDAEVASAIAPGANIEIASCTNLLIALENVVGSSTPPNIISMSYLQCESVNGSANNAAYNTAHQTGAAAGISIFVSSGDGGAAGCWSNDSYGESDIGVNGLGSTQYNVSVGGTDFEDSYNATKASPTIPVSTYWSTTNTPTDGSAKSYIPEIPWNNSCASWLAMTYVGTSTATYGQSGWCNSGGAITTSAASGGPSGCYTGTTTNADYVNGSCAGYPKPSWQSVFGNPADDVRDTPDVSLFASSGVWGHYIVVCYSDPAYTADGAIPCTGPPNTWSGFGGTSAAAPAMAAIQALVNQKWGKTWQGTYAGNPAPIYYQIARTQFGATGNSACYSINQPPRRGLASECAFYDITQGDNDVPCKQPTHKAGCYLPSGTYGVMSTQPLATVAGTVAAAGSGYSGTLTCTLAAPSNLSSYLNPSGGTIWAGGSAGTCTATLSGSTVGTVTISAGGQGYAGGAGCTITGSGGGSGAVCGFYPPVGTAPAAYQPAYGATPGWDFATGLGSVNAYNLVFNTAW